MNVRKTTFVRPGYAQISKIVQKIGHKAGLYSFLPEELCRLFLLRRLYADAFLIISLEKRSLLEYNSLR